MFSLNHIGNPLTHSQPKLSKGEGCVCVCVAKLQGYRRNREGKRSWYMHTRTHTLMDSLGDGFLKKVLKIGHNAERVQMYSMNHTGIHQKILPNLIKSSVWSFWQATHYADYSEFGFSCWVTKISYRVIGKGILYRNHHERPPVCMLNMEIWT